MLPYDAPSGLVRRIVLPLAAAVLAAAAASPPAQVAAARPLRCGDIVKSDTVLTANLSNCRTRGLVLGADGITLDLNGHRITGKGFGIGVLATGRRNVHITGSGRVSHFETAVRMKNTTKSEVDEITAADNTIGVVVAGGSADTVFHVTARRNFEGIELDGGDGHVAALNNISADDADGSGIVLGGHSKHARILDNHLNGTEFVGIFLSNADRTVVEGNRMTDTGRGIFLFPASHSRISYNEISGGPKRRTGVGIAVSGGTGNAVDHNVIEAATEDGIALSSSRPFDGFPAKAPPTTDTVVLENVVRRAGGDGFAVQTGDSGAVLHTRLIGNRAERSGDDGFDVRNRTTTIKGDVARANADYGIVAVRGVSDGGHNRASGNHHRPQCKSVRCS
jgi:parallel beta-helix repeat protein